MKTVHLAAQSDPDEYAGPRVGGGIGAALMRECVRRARGAGAPARRL
jgi:hypothetical protein